MIVHVVIGRGRLFHLFAESYIELNCVTHVRKNLAEIWKPQPIEVYRSWVDAILSEASDKLNDWETKFIESIDERITLRLSLSQSQAEKLEQIYVKYTS